MEQWILLHVFAGLVSTQQINAYVECDILLLWVVLRNCCCLAGLAAVVGTVFLPSITSDSVQRAVEVNPEKFIVSQKGGIIATEEILEHDEDHIGTFVLG
ncbi:TPA: hypothetical protein ACH3X1_015388 [Trebouxia sp. C0004]